MSTNQNIKQGDKIGVVLPNWKNGKEKITTSCNTFWLQICATVLLVYDGLGHQTAGWLPHVELPLADF